MSNRNPNLNIQDVIPVFSPLDAPSIFTGSEARFAVGQVAESVPGQMPLNGYEHGTRALANFPGVILDGFKEVVHQYGILRANTYIDQTGMLTQQVRNSRGEEWDQDDARSDHFVTLERVFAEDPLVRDTVEKFEISPDSDGFVLRIPNCMRVIKKTALHPKTLPIEEFFPDAAYPGNGELVFPAALGAIELSRKIALHEEPRTSRMLSNPMFAKATIHTVENGLGPAFATIEKFYEEIFRKTGIPMTRIADPKYLGEYADDNLGIEIDYIRLAEMLGIDAVKSEVKTRQPFTLYGNVLLRDAVA